MESLSVKQTIEAIKAAASPKQALDGAKFVWGGSLDYEIIFKECLDLAWEDATARNKKIARAKGKPKDHPWKPRRSLSEQEIKDCISRIFASGNPAGAWGQVLESVDEAGIKKIFETVNAQVAELAYASDSKSGALTGLRDRTPPCAP